MSHDAPTVVPAKSAAIGPEPGTILAGKFRAERVLGVGGMGIVVAARHLQLDQRVAIKYLLPHALANPEVVARFAREARTCAKIRGEHVARVIDVSQFDDGTPFMVLEYLDGHDLSAELTANGPLRIEDAVHHVLETCEALAEAHAAGVVHRDLKPANLFLAAQPDKRFIVKVLDFGISRSVDPGDAALTGTNTMLGTPSYMSPEQVADPKGIDHRTDIWAIGVILYELLTGQKPFSGDTWPMILLAIVTGSPRPVRELRPDVPEGLEAVIMRCLGATPDDRFPNVAELAAALAPFGTEQDHETVASTARVLGLEAPPRATVVARSAASPLDETLIDRASVVARAHAAGGELANDGSPLAAPMGEPPPAWAQSVAEIGVAGTLIAESRPGWSKEPVRHRPRPLVFGGGAVALLVVAGLAVALWSKRRPSDEPTSTPIVAVSEPSVASPPVAAAAVVPAAVDPSSSSPAVASAAPSASVVVKRPGVRAKASATAPIPVAAPPKNPLEMGLK